MHSGSSPDQPPRPPRRPSSNDLTTMSAVLTLSLASPPALAPLLVRQLADVSALVAVVDTSDEAAPPALYARSTGDLIASGEAPVCKAMARMRILPDVQKQLLGADEAEEASVDQWLSLCCEPPAMNAQPAFANAVEAHLQTRTFVATRAGPSVADAVLAARVYALVAKMKNGDKVGKFASLCRWFGHMQALVPGVLPEVAFPETSFVPPAAPETGAADAAAQQGAKGGAAADKKAKSGDEKSAAAPAPSSSSSDTAGGAKKAAKAEKKKEKGGGGDGKPAAAPAKAAASGPPIDVSRVMIKVGTITEVGKHPDADALYVEKIDLGEEGGPRTVVSGLVKHYPVEEMQNRRVLVVCNLKPAKMRGVESQGMVLCGTGEDGKVEFIEPPEGVPNGERVLFPGYTDVDGVPEPESPFMPPKKKMWEAVQPDFATDGACVAKYKDVAFTTSKGPCKSKTVTNAGIK